MRSWSKSALAWLTVLMLAACSSAGTATSDAGADSGGSGGSGGGGDTVACNASPQTWPAFERGCTDTPSCVIAKHMIDCCGTILATGINHAELARFNADEAACESQYPGCGCASQGTLVDTGATVMDPTTIQVECRSGTCTTFAP